MTIAESILSQFNEAVEIKIGDFISKVVKHGEGHSSHTRGYVVDTKGGSLVMLADQWGGHDERRWHDTKGFKVNKSKSKKVSTFKPVMDLIHKLGNKVNDNS